MRNNEPPFLQDNKKITSDALYPFETKSSYTFSQAPLKIRSIFIYDPILSACFAA